MKIVRKLFSAVLAVSMMSTLFASYASAEISGTPLIAIDASEYTGTAGETFNLYVNVTGIETSKTDNNNLTGVSDFTLEVVLPEGLTINVEDGTDPYEIYDEIDSNAARYGAADAAASSFLNNVFSYSCTFKRRLTQTDTGVYLTLPVTVVTVPTEEVEIGFGPKTMVIFKEYTAGSQTDILELGYANDPTPYKTAKIGKTAEPEEPKVEIAPLEKGGDMYGMKTKVSKVKIPDGVEVSKAVVTLDGTSQEYDLPAGVKGALEGFIAIIRYSTEKAGENPAFTLEIK